MKGPILIILSLLAVSVIGMGLVLGLSEAVNAHGGFRRTYVERPLLSADTIDLTYDSYYIAGQTGHTLYLGNYSAPRHVVSVDVLTGDTTHIALAFENPDRIPLGDVKCRIDSPRVFLYDGTAPIIFQGDLLKKIVRPGDVPIPYFLDMEPMAGNRFSFRSLTSDGVAQLAYADVNEIAIPGILRKQVDGVFCTTGTMSYDQKFRELIYVHLYRNEVIILDTCLRIQRTIHTIDTVTTAKLSVASTSSGSLSVFSSPPVMVNRQSSVYDGRLVIHSQILADNDDVSKFERGSDFDFYDLRNTGTGGSYLYTVYIPNFQNDEAKFHRMFNFQINNRLAVLYPRHLLIYRVFNDN